MVEFFRSEIGRFNEIVSLFEKKKHVVSARLEFLSIVKKQLNLAKILESESVFQDRRAINETLSVLKNSKETKIIESLKA